MSTHDLSCPLTIDNMNAICKDITYYDWKFWVEPLYDNGHYQHGLTVCVTRQVWDLYRNIGTKVGETKHKKSPKKWFGRYKENGPSYVTLRQDLCGYILTRSDFLRCIAGCIEWFEMHEVREHLFYKNYFVKTPHPTPWESLPSTLEFINVYWLVTTAGKLDNKKDPIPANGYYKALDDATIADIMKRRTKESEHINEQITSMD